MSGRGSINANNNSNKNQQQKIQKDLRDANKATRVLLTVPPHPNAARQRKELKTINAALLCDPAVLASCPHSEMLRLDLTFTPTSALRPLSLRCLPFCSSTRLWRGSPRS
jgi:hypothetical protein